MNRLKEFIRSKITAWKEARYQKEIEKRFQLRMKIITDPLADGRIWHRCVRRCQYTDAYNFPRTCWRLTVGDCPGGNRVFFNDYQEKFLTEDQIRTMSAAEWMNTLNIVRDQWQQWEFDREGFPTVLLTFTPIPQELFAEAGGYDIAHP